MRKRACQVGGPHSPLMGRMLPQEGLSKGPAKGLESGAIMFQKSTHAQPAFSRRSLSRLQASQDIWVCWQCNGFDDFSRVLDISPQGLFLESAHPKIAVGTPTKLDFLVEEGRIRADAVVRHVKRGSGLGLKFTAVPDADSVRLKTLIARMARSALASQA